MRFLRCDNAGHNYRSEYYDYAGALTSETTAVRTGGATDQTTKIAWKLVTSANASLGAPLQTFPIARWNAVTGSNRTVTIHGIVNATAVPNTDEIWIDVDYLGDASSALSSNKSSRIADFLASGSAITADSTSAWDSVAAARQNSQAYSLGAMISLSSNPGRLFFCTTAGTSAGSEPAGYASAVDGGSVTDGTAVFRAGCRFKMAVTLTSPQPQQAGMIYARARAAKKSVTFYVDPFLALS